MSALAQEIGLTHPIFNFIGQPRKMMIGGKWVKAASGETLDVFNPATEEIVAKVPAGDKAVTIAL